MANMPPMPQAQTILAGMSMIFMGGLGVLLVLHDVPPNNHDYIIYILGALSGALTVGGVQKLAQGDGARVDSTPQKEDPK